jgi:6-phosphogluconolactonase/glucosamine-6-phosphate isomerase/deaminase
LERERRVVALFVERLSAHRVTLTVPALSAAREGMMTAVGAEKAAALARALTVRDLPVALVRSPQMIWLVDAAVVPSQKGGIDGA